VVTPAAFGAIAGDFILDLSQPQSQLDATRALAAGLTDPTVTADLRLAGDRLPRATLAVAPLDARALHFVTPIAGVIGADILRRRSLELAFSPCRIALTRSRPSRRAAASLPLTWIAGRPTLAAAVSDGVASRKGRFAIDTASPRVRVENARLSRPGDESRARLRALSIAGRLFENLPAALGAPDAIGTEVWSAYRLRISRSRLDLFPSSTASAGEVADRAAVGRRGRKAPGAAARPIQPAVEE
jgi:hypothetical protein